MRNIKPTDVCEYQCKKCGHRFTITPPPVSGTDCQACGHPYVRWTNYEKLISKNLDERRK